MSTLNPCPFCGRKLELRLYDWRTEQYVFCRHCGARGPIQHGFSWVDVSEWDMGQEAETIKVEGDGARMAEASWNKRESGDSIACPWCGGSPQEKDLLTLRGNPSLDETGKIVIASSSARYACTCPICHAHGPFSTTEDGAWEKWVVRP
jgi:hypothetical protein